MTEMILRSNQEQAPKVKQPRRFSAKNIVSTVITVLLLGITFTAGLGITGTPETSVSSAYAKDCWGPGMDPNGPEATHQITGAWPGALGNLSPAGSAAGGASDITGAGSSPVDSKQLTAYEWYGTAGMSYYQGTWFDNTGCSILVDGANGLSNFIQGVTTLFGEVLLTIIAWGLNASYVQELITGDDAVITKIIKGFQDSLYLRWFLPLVTLAAAAIAYAGLVRKRGSEAIQGTIWVVASAALALIFFTYPTQIASWVDKTVISIGNEITSATARVPGVQMGQNNPEDLCYIDKVNLGEITADSAFDEEAAKRAVNQEMRVSQCVLWKTFIYQPWAASQFGPLANSESLRVPDAAKASFRGNTTLPIVFLDTRVQNRSEVLSDELDTERREAQWTEFKKVMLSDEASSGWANFSGVPAESRIGPTMVGFFGLLFGLGPLTFLSITLVVQQVLMLLLLLLAPIALTVGIFPGRGRKIMLGWLEMFLGTVIKRFIAYVLVAVLIAAMTAIMISDSSGSNFLLQVGLVAAIGFGVLNIRKVIEQRFGTVNLGGDQGSFMQENLNAVKQGAKQTRGIITQPTSNFAKSRGEGKSFTKSLGSAVKGVSEGAKTGGPTIREAAKAAAKAPQQRNDVRVQAEEEAMAKQADITAKRQARKAADSTRKATAKLNNNLAQLNENLAPRVREEASEAGYEGTVNANIPDAAPSNFSEEYTDSGVEPVLASTPSSSNYEEKLAKLKRKEDSIQSDIKAIQESINYLDSSVQAGRISPAEAKYQKDGMTMQLMSLREDEQFIAIEKKQLENNQE
jgi:hypothetical protein